VVFWDMGSSKVQRLVTSDLSNLASEFNQSPTTLLRALHMWHKLFIDVPEGQEVEADKEQVAKCLAPVFSLPFFRSPTAQLGTQVSYHTRFATQLLVNEGIIGSDGSMCNLSNLLVHLFEVEPANFLLNRLLTTGVLHKYLKSEKKKEDKADRRTHLTVKFVGILAWFLFRRRLPAMLPGEHITRKKYMPSKSCPALPPLPPDMLTEIHDYNSGVFELYQEFAFAVATTEKFREADLVLPLSRREFRLGWDERGVPFGEGSEFQGEYLKQLTAYRARSPFVAIGGLGDRFASPHDLVKSIRNVLHMDISSLPIIPYTLEEDEAGETVQVLENTNSWIMDFMIHGKTKYLLDDNGIDATKAWALIAGFISKLEMLSAVVLSYSNKDDIVYVSLEKVITEMKAAHKANS